MSTRKSIGGKKLLLVQLALLDAAEWQDGLAASLVGSNEQGDIENRKKARALAGEYRKMHAALSPEEG